MSKKTMEDGSYIAMNKCYYCGESKDIFIDTRFRDISEVNGAVTDVEPCNKCKEFMKQGVIAISIRDGEPQEGDPPNPYRTGGWWVLSVEYVKRAFNHDFTDKVQRCIFIEDSVAKAVGLEIPSDSDTSGPTKKT